jgi:hypothetical protein
MAFAMKMLRVLVFQIKGHPTDVFAAQSEVNGCTQDTSTHRPNPPNFSCHVHAWLKNNFPDTWIAHSPYLYLPNFPSLLLREYFHAREVQDPVSGSIVLVAETDNWFLSGIPFNNTVQHKCELEEVTEQIV